MHPPGKAARAGSWVGAAGKLSGVPEGRHELGLSPVASFSLSLHTILKTSRNVALFGKSALLLGLDLADQYNGSYSR